MKRTRHLPAMPPGAKPPAIRTRGRRELSLLKTATHWLDTIAARLLPYDATNPFTPDQRARPTILIGLTLMLLLLVLSACGRRSFP